MVMAAKKILFVFVPTTGLAAGREIAIRRMAFAASVGSFGGAVCEDWDGDDGLWHRVTVRGALGVFKMKLGAYWGDDGCAVLRFASTDPRA